jgi:hypothetical protein
MMDGMLQQQLTVMIVGIQTGMKTHLRFVLNHHEMSNQRFQMSCRVGGGPTSIRFDRLVKSRITTMLWPVAIQKTKEIDIGVTCNIE